MEIKGIDVNFTQSAIVEDGYPKLIMMTQNGFDGDKIWIEFFMTNHRENMLVAELLRSMGYRGDLAAVVRHEDHAKEMHGAGISPFNLYGEAGSGFAAHASELLPADRA